MIKDIKNKGGIKYFMLKVFLFMTLLTCFSYGLDYAITSGIRKTEASRYNPFGEIFYPNYKYKYLIMGHSRAKCQINPYILDSIMAINSYNLGLFSSRLYEQVNIYSKVVKNNDSLKVIIYSADNTLLEYRPTHREDIVPFLSHIDYKYAKTVGFSNYDILFPLVRYYGYNMEIRIGLMEFLNIRHINDNLKKGYFGVESHYDGTEFEKLLMKGDLPAIKDTAMVELFDKFLSECKAKGIKVVMVFSPQYIKATEHTKDLDQVIKIYNDFSQKYDFPFLDYSHDSLCYDTAYFYNATHLNKTGAELFSVKLANDIKNLNLEN
jgi:hypothetical protein